MEKGDFLKIVVTGGAGFIGSNLVHQLVADGHEVIAIDNFLLGSMDNLKGLEDKIKFLEGDIRNSGFMNDALKGADVVFNEAAASASPMFMKDLRDAVSVNVDGFINVLDAMRKNNVKKLVYASSSSIYGNAKELLSEDMVTEIPNFYAVTKKFNEDLSRVYSNQYGIDCIGLRYMSVYGPREEAKAGLANLASQFLWGMQNNERPILYGDGSQSRDFTYVKDIVNANILAMNSDIKWDIFNVGTGKVTSLNELVAILNKLLGKSIEPTYVENKVKGYIAYQQGDTAKAKDKLGFEAKYTLEQGLEEMISGL